ncbi:MAG TPA: STAS domain-containing protein [Solirubrobacterales bacterium]|nr:STAS domain-containing protein [Solirubrobacterales bacterium]
MAERLEIAVEDRQADAGPVVFIRVTGEVDLANADQLADALRGDGVRDAAGVVLDLRGVPFMDSSGLRVLLMAVKEPAPVVTVIAPDSPVARLLELAEVTDRVPAYTDEEKAIDGITASGSRRDG